MENIAAPIVLIGPVSVGKSTIGKLLSEKLGLPNCSVDDIRWQYYDEIGYDKEVVSQIARSEGIMGIVRYWKPFEAHTVERVLVDYPHSVIDFGAGHSVYEDDKLFERVQKALASYPNVILLLPSADLDQSVAILNGRFAKLLQEETGEVNPELLKMNEHFVRHPSNRQLAKMVIYTEGQTPEETCIQIIENLKKTEQ